MQGLQVMVPIAAGLEHHLRPISVNLTNEDHVLVLAKLLQQSVGKVDRICGCAATTMVAILYAEVDPEAAGIMGPGENERDHEYVLRVPHRADMMKVVSKSEEMRLIWLQASEVCARILQLLYLPEYRFELLLGFVISAGGLTETLVGV